jgi:hypothetical protein
MKLFVFSASMIVVSALFTMSCNLPKNNTTGKTNLQVTALTGSLPYTDVALGDMFVGKSKVGFEITGSYETGNPTPGAAQLNLPLADDGQQLFIRFDNEPPGLYSENSFQKMFKDGDITVFAILLRSNYESIKNGKAHYFSKVTIQERKVVKQTPITTPTIILINPWAPVKGNTMLLDYFVANAPAGSSVLLDIDGEKHTLHDFQARRISGLTPGEHTLRLLLIDAQKKALAPSIVHKVTVVAQ